MIKAFYREDPEIFCQLFIYILLKFDDLLKFIHFTNVFYVYKIVHLQFNKQASVRAIIPQ